MFKEIKALIKEAHRDPQALHLKINNIICQFRQSPQGDLMLVPIESSLVTAQYEPRFKDDLTKLVKGFETEADYEHKYKEAIECIKKISINSAITIRNLKSVNDIEIVPSEKVYEDQSFVQYKPEKVDELNLHLRVAIKFARAMAYNTDMFHAIVSPFLNESLWQVAVNNNGTIIRDVNYLESKYVHVVLEKLFNIDEEYIEDLNDILERLGEDVLEMSDKDFSTYLIAMYRVSFWEDDLDFSSWGVDAIVETMINNLGDDHRQYVNFDVPCQWVTPTEDLTKSGEICLNFKSKLGKEDKIPDIPAEELVALSSYMGLPTNCDSIVICPEEPVVPGYYIKHNYVDNRFNRFLKEVMGPAIDNRGDSSTLSVDFYDSANGGNKFKLGKGKDNKFYLFPMGYETGFMCFDLLRGQTSKAGRRLGPLVEVPKLRDNQVHIPLGETVTIYAKVEDQWKGYILSEATGY